MRAAVAKRALSSALIIAWFACRCCGADPAPPADPPVDGAAAPPVKEAPTLWEVATGANDPYRGWLWLHSEARVGYPLIASVGENLQFGGWPSFFVTPSLGLSGAKLMGGIGFAGGHGSTNGLAPAGLGLRAGYMRLWSDPTKLSNTTETDNLWGGELTVAAGLAGDVGVFYSQRKRGAVFTWGVGIGF